MQVEVDEEVKLLLEAFQMSVGACLAHPAVPLLRAQMLGRLMAATSAASLQAGLARCLQKCIIVLGDLRDWKSCWPSDSLCMLCCTGCPSARLPLWPPRPASLPRHWPAKLPTTTEDGACRRAWRRRRAQRRRRAATRPRRRACSAARRRWSRPAACGA